jgi:hypothetical protein
MIGVNKLTEKIIRISNPRIFKFEAAGLRMVTFDKDFERFNLSRLEVLALPV